MPLRFATNPAEISKNSPRFQPWDQRAKKGQCPEGTAEVRLWPDRLGFSAALELVIWACLCALFAIHAPAQTLTDSQLSEIRFNQKLNSRISLDLQFRDEDERTVPLRNYFGKRPVILVLGYYECPMLCTLTFNGMVEGLNDMKWSIGDQFTVVHLSIDPKETPALASAKKQTYLKRYGRAGAASGWHFLTGQESAIRQLADQVGFHFAYDPAVKQYAHPSGLVILTPDGTISKYFFGVKFAPNELYASLQAASERKVGSPIERLILLCFHYSPLHGRYGSLIITTLRILGIVTLAGMAWFFAAMIRAENRKRRVGFLRPAISEAAPASAGNPPRQV